MRLKLFHAPDMAEAMARVRASLGADALILSTRQVAGGVEIAAALERDDLPPALDPRQPPSPPDTRPRARPGEPAAPAAFVRFASLGPAGQPLEAPTDRRLDASHPARERPRPVWPTIERAAANARPAPDRKGTVRPVSAHTPSDRPPPGRSPSDKAPAGPGRLRGPDDGARSRLLRYHGVPTALHPALLHGDFATGLAAAIGFSPLPLDCPLLLAGPPGAGKTLTIARLATRLVLAGLRPLVITADGQRAGATEQLAAFTRLLGIDLIVADTPHLLTRAMQRRGRGVPALIDCFGIAPLELAAGAAILDLAGAAAATLIGVLPAGIDPEEASDLGAALHAMGSKHLIVTRIDLARRLGSTLAAAAAGLELAEAGIGPGAADGLIPATPEWLAERLTRAIPSAVGLAAVSSCGTGRPAPGTPETGPPA